VGRNQYALHVKDLQSGELLPDTATNIAPNLVWANDHKTVFFVAKDPVTLRTNRVFRHALGGADALVFQEDDGQFYVGVSATKSRRFVAIDLTATASSRHA
jgi:oligopeptidase B